MNWFPSAFLTALFESFSNVLGKRGAQKINTLSAAWSAKFFSIFIILPIAMINNFFIPTHTTFWIALFATSSLNTITSILFIKAIKDSPLSLTLPIVTFTPAFLLITSPLIVGEFPAPLGILGVLLVFAGSYILNLSKRVHGPFEPILSIFRQEGPRLMFIVAFIWSISSNIDKIGVKNSNPFIFSLFNALTVMVFLTFVLRMRGVSLMAVFKNSKILAPIGITSGLTHVFQMIAISQTLVPYVISVKRLSTFFGALWGYFFFKEKDIKERLLGTVIMIAGVVLITLS